MQYIKPSTTKFVAASVATMVMALAASRQLYLFVASRNADGQLDAQGGEHHLWLAAGAALLAAVAACLMFLFFLGLGKSEPFEAPASKLGPSPAPIDVKSNINSPAPGQFNAARWGQLNEWCVGGQADDRRPMNGGVLKGVGSASAQRAAARLTHQGMYKVWAQERHD
ncbi:MAG TPA: hypothetical protein VN256_07780 [Pyrinomonadaceae bacterium]|nr:hypothetical protein [Pyrinomonadaceae bacterium]